MEQRLLSPDFREEIRELPKTELLKRVRIFKIMNDEHLARSPPPCRKGNLANMKSSSPGEEGSSLFIIEEGLVNILVTDAKGKNRWVAHIQPGAFSGDGPVDRRNPGPPRSRPKPR